MTSAENCVTDERVLDDSICGVNPPDSYTASGVSNVHEQGQRKNYLRRVIPATEQNLPVLCPAESIHASGIQVSSTRETSS